MTEPGRMQSLAMRLSLFRDIYRMVGRSKRWWLLPMLVVLVVFGLALAGLQAVEYLSPFIYAVL